MISTQVAIVILNWNGAAHLREYLPSVIQYSRGARIIVADNGSTDDSYSVVEEFGSLEWLALPENYGFAEGYNRALAQVEAEIYVLLNSDVRVSAGWLNAPVSTLERDVQIAAVQPKILADARPEFFEYAGAAGGFLDKLAYPHCRGRVFDTVEKDLGQYDDACDVDWATGACLFIRADVWREVGGLDGDFFAHMEEIDLCWRIRANGYRCRVEPSSVVYHLGGGTLAYNSPNKVYLNFRNSLCMILKNQQTATVIPKLFMRMVLDGIAGLKFLIEGEPQLFWAVVRAHLAFYTWIPRMVKKRSTTYTSSILSQQTREQRRPKSTVWNYYVLGRKTFSALYPWR